MKLSSANHIAINLKLVTLVFFLPLFARCQNLHKEEVIFYDYFLNTTLFKFNVYDNSEKEDLASQLRTKVNRLEQINDKYKLERLGRIRKGSSNVYSAIANKPELFRSSHIHYVIDDFSKFDASIHKVNYAKITINPDSGDSSSKAIIEELVFYSEEDCKTLLSYINHVREIEYFWDSIDKYKSDIFIEGNKFYFVSIQGRILHSNNVPPMISKILRD